MRLKVAFLDDDVMVCKTYTKMAEKLTSRGKHNLELVPFNTVEKFQACIDNSFDLFVLDWHLGPGDPCGQEVAKKVKDRFPQKVVILQSGNPMVQDNIDSMVRKERLSCPNLYRRYLRLKRDNDRNVLELYLIDGYIGAK